MNRRAIAMKCFKTHLLITTLLVGLGAGQVCAQATTKEPLPLVEMKVLAEAYSILKSSLATPISGESLLTAAVRGMVRDVDPEGAFLTEADVKAMLARPRASQPGIDAVLSSRGGQFFLNPEIGGAADLAGLRPHDALLAVDERGVDGLVHEQVASLLQGEVGSRVTLTVRRGDLAVPANVTLERRPPLPAALRLTRLEGGLLVLRVPVLADRMLESLVDQLGEETRAGGCKGLVLDLRRSPGGLLNSAIALAALFLPTDVVIAETVGRYPEARTTFRAAPASYAPAGAPDPLARAPKVLKTLPLVLLVDEGTASGAEIVVAALKDHHRATVVGRTTFGRGSIQTVTPLPAGHALKYTSAHWRSPSGASFDREGVKPDEWLAPADAQAELDAAVAVLRARMVAAR